MNNDYINHRFKNLLEETKQTRPNTKVELGEAILKDAERIFNLTDQGKEAIQNIKEIGMQDTLNRGDTLGAQVAMVVLCMTVDNSSHVIQQKCENKDVSVIQDLAAMARLSVNIERYIQLDQNQDPNTPSGH